MPYLINPFGRMVPINDQKQYDELLAQGFTKPTPDQEKDFIKKRFSMLEEMQQLDDKAGGLYMATVSQGGKDGYSIASKGLIKELNIQGLKTETHYIGQKVCMLFHNPYSILRIEAPYRIIYTMFESDKIPDDWLDYLQAADKVIVPSNWCAKVFAKSDVATEVIPLGYDENVFKFHQREVKRHKNGNFTFLHYNAFNIRKGFTEVLKAFTKEFKKDEPVRMIFCTTLENIPLPITPQEYPNIEIIRGKKTEKELVDILNRSDAFVFPSRGEGFGITPLEAMATGLPTIVPDAHGISEYFHEDYMYEVKVGETCPALYSRYKNQDVGKMVVCDVDDLRRQMRYIYEHQEEALEMGKKAAEYVKTWTIQKTATKIKDMVNDILSKPIDQKPLRNVLTLEKVT